MLLKRNRAKVSPSNASQGTGKLKEFAPAVNGWEANICSSASQEPLRSKSTHASNCPEADAETVMSVELPIRAKFRNATPSSSPIPFVSSPNAVGSGWPSASPSMRVPRKKPGRIVCCAPSFTRSVGYGTSGASPKSVSAAVGGKNSSAPRPHVRPVAPTNVRVPVATSSVYRLCVAKFAPSATYSTPVAGSKSMPATVPSGTLKGVPERIAPVVLSSSNSSSVHVASTYSAPLASKAIADRSIDAPGSVAIIEPAPLVVSIVKNS